jgi:hypothetical protein
MAIGIRPRVVSRGAIPKAAQDSDRLTIRVGRNREGDRLNGERA